MNPAQFVAKWSRVDLPERAASQEHFIDLCRLLGQPTPAEHDAAFFHLYGIEREDAEYMLSTFTQTGYIKPEQRLDPKVAWAKSSIGEAVLDAYDNLTASR